MSEELDMLAEEMGNSKNKKVIIYINELPIIEAKAITSPIDNKWLNILAIIVLLQIIVKMNGTLFMNQY